jgi:hypothetical protein
MSFSLSSLSDYKIENKSELISKMMALSQTIKYVTVQPGVPFGQSIKIPLNESTLYVGAVGCGLARSGTTSVTQREILCVGRQVEDELCNADAKPKFLAYKMKAGKAGLEDVNFGEMFIEEKLNKIGNYNDTYWWLLAKPLLQQNSGTTVNIFSTTGNSTGFTVQNAVTILDAFKLNVPDFIKSEDDLTIFMGLTTFDTCIQAIKNDKNYWVDPSVKEKYVYDYFGMKLIGTSGIKDGSAYLTTKSNAYWVTDLIEDSESLDLWYSKDDNKLYMRTIYGIGAGFLWYEGVVCLFR